MGTKNNPGQFDCYAKAEPDEPMFVLLGRDKHAPTLIWLWAALRELDDNPETEKVKEARECASEMIQYGLRVGKSAVGLGQATLAGVMELIRMANCSAKKIREQDFNNLQTGNDFIRLVLAETRFQEPPTEEQIG